MCQELGLQLVHQFCGIGTGLLGSLSVHDGPQLCGNLIRIRELAGRQLRVEDLAIVGDLKGVDGLERLRNHVEAVDGTRGEELVLMHLVQKLGRRPSKLSKKLLAREKEDSGTDLQRPNCADGILHRSGWCVRTTLYLETWDGVLQALCAALELPVDLSGAAELDP